MRSVEGAFDFIQTAILIENSFRNMRLVEGAFDFIRRFSSTDGGETSSGVVGKGKVFGITCMGYFCCFGFIFGRVIIIIVIIIIVIIIIVIVIIVIIIIVIIISFNSSLQEKDSICTPTIQAVFNEQLIRILDKCDDTVKETRAVFEAKKNNPPRTHSIPPAAGAIAWASFLLQVCVFYVLFEFVNVVIIMCI
jgi:hypothetical protein